MRKREMPLNKCSWCGKSTRNLKYCSNAHQMTAQRAPLIAAWLAGEHDGCDPSGNAAAWVKRFLIEERGEKCEVCGWAEKNPANGLIPIQLDHIDGDAQNNAYSNLQLLCPNHHALTPTYGGLNHPNGRKKHGVTPLPEDRGRVARREARRRGEIR